MKDSIKMRIIDELRGEQEQIEDMLENIYALWHFGKNVFMDDLLGKMTITKWEYKRYMKKLSEKGYIQPCECETDYEKPVSLTSKGKELGAEIMRRHQYLKGFLKAVCNVDDETADHDACRIEHIISDEVLSGIRNFMKTGNVADRVVSGHDLSEFYSEGKYIFDVSLYYPNSNSPRILCKEFYDFGEDIETEVSADGNSFFYLKPLDGKKDERKREGEIKGKFEGEERGYACSCIGKETKTGYEDVWFLLQNEWHKAAWNERGFRIPSDSFVYTISGAISVMSGEGKIAFTEANREPEEENIRTISVCLW